MSFEGFLSRNYPQTAVYWGNPQEDGYGGKIFDTPIEIKCRWEDRIQVVGADPADDRGMKYLSRGVVYISQDLEQEGCLYLGTLESLAAYEESDGSILPRNVPNAFIIKRFEKVPGLSSTNVFLRKAFLTPWLT